VITHSQSAVSHLFQKLTDALEGYDQDLFDLDCDDLKLELLFGNGSVLLINYHQSTEQLWVSSPKSGAHHFAHRDNEWRCTRTAQKFMEFLTNELQQLTGEKINLDVT
jgi:frataxin